MINHHPDGSLLTEYAAGSLDWAVSLSVAAHLHFCSACRSQVASLNVIGGTLLSHCDRAGPDPGSFESLMTRIRVQADARAEQAAADNHSAEAPNRPIPVSKNTALNNAPRVLRKLIPRNRKLRWKIVSPSIKMAPLKTGQEKYQVSLHRISIGGKAAEHDHRGKEITLVLQGGFSDGDGLYVAGDFLVREPGQVHCPTAAQNEDCICLTVVEAPVAVTGLIGKVLNPLLSVRPG